MELIESILGNLNDYMYTYILVLLLLLAGLYFTFKVKFAQITMLPDAIRQIGEKNNKEGAMSSFQALMISTASRVGVGNIAGVATAIAAGGAGSVFWMWVIAMIGAASAFVESTLAQIYKVKDGEGFKGGPSFYIQKCLGSRWLGVLFSIFLIACFAYGFNSLQANTIVSSLSYYFGDTDKTTFTIVVGVVLSAITAYIVYGGDKKITFMTSIVVPLMAIIYLLLGIVILIKNFSLLPNTITQIFSQAFDFQAIFGAFTGSCVLWGIKRGLFSNEAGMGSAPNAAAAADVSHPVKQGLVQMVSVFIDTLVICTTSGFIILLSGVDISTSTGMPLVQKAVASEFGEIGILIVTISVFFFAFSSIIGNYYYTKSNMLFILNKDSSLNIFNLTVVFAVFLGSILSSDLVWNLSDIFMGFMAIINIFVILKIGNKVKVVMEDYKKQKSEGKNPEFVAANVGIDDTDVW